MSVQIELILSAMPTQVRLSRGSATDGLLNMRAAENAEAQSLIFVGTPNHLRAALETKAKTWVVSEDLEAKVPAHIPNVLVSKNVQLAMATIARQFFRPTKHHVIVNGAKVHPSAHVSPLAQLGKNCIVGPGAVIGDGCVVGDDCIVGANSVLEHDVRVGARTHIHPLVYLGHSCEVGEDCEIHPHTTIGSEGYGYAQDPGFNHFRITHFGRVIIEDRVHIGAGVQIDRGTFLDSRVGSGSKIDNHCHFGHNIEIGKNTLITGGMITAGSTQIGSYCVFGGRVSIKGHLRVGDKVQVSAMSCVGKDITKPGEYGGFPLQDIRSEMRVRASLKSLPDLLKQVRRILKHLNLESDSTQE